MSFFANRVVLITGAGAGIGRQLAVDLAAGGAAIAALDINAEALATLADQLQGKPAAWATADVTDREALLAGVDELQKRLGPIDVLIANAGVGRETSALLFHAREFEEMIRVNLIGVANSIEAVLQGMLKRRRGHLVGISSLASFRGIPGMAAYCASKSGVNALLESMRPELKPFGIDVTIVCPGWIRTAMTAGISVPAAELMDVATAARQIITAIAKRRPFHAFPPVGRRRMRLLRWLPSSTSDWLLARALRRLGQT